MSDLVRGSAPCQTPNGCREHEFTVHLPSRTSDGYALAVGWRGGWSIWTVYGKLTSWAVGSDAAGSEGGQAPSTFEDRFMSGVYRLFWAPGNLTLFALCLAPDSPKERGNDGGEICL